MLLSILMPLLPAACFLAFGMYWLSHAKIAPAVRLPAWLMPKDGTLTRAALVRLAGITALAEAAFFAVLWGVIRFGMHEEGGIPAWALLLTAAVPFLALLLRCFLPQHRRAGRVFLHLSALLAVLLTAEVLLCNAGSFTSEKNTYDLSMDEIMPQDSAGEAEVIHRTEDCYIIDDTADFCLTGIPSGTRAILLHMEQPDEEHARLVHVWLDMEDGNSSLRYVTVRDRMTMAKGRDTVLSIDPYGDVRSLMLHFNMVYSPVELRGVTAVSALPFDFSGVRFLLALLLGGLLICILDLRLWEIVYTRTRRQRLAVALVTALCVCSAVCFWEPGETLQVYRPNESHSTYDPYILTFDAFQKGQVFLDLPVDPALASLENVYDDSERDEAGVSYRWDMAYKDGKYYSYFGVTPILVLYYPLYLLTGKLPTVPIAVDVFATLAGLLLCLTILAAVRLTVKRPNFLLLLLSLPTAMGTGAVYTCLQYNDKYYEAVSCGMCFLLLTLWLGMRGCLAKRMPVRCILFGLCGLSMALCVGARPTMAVSTALLVPLFLGILLRKSAKLSGRLAQTVCFAIPLLCGMAGLLAYNSARFGSPLDFGSAYQLTVSDTHANTLRLSLLPAAWKHYLLQTPIPRTTFPYFEPINSSLRNYGRYLYTDATYGALALPCVLLGTLLLPLGLQRGTRQTTAGVTLLQKRAVLLLCFAVPALLAWVDFCMGGVNQRYVTDLMPLFTIGAVLVLLRTVDLKHHRYRYGIALLSLVLTAGMIWLLMIGLRDCALLRHCPGLYDAAENALVFWA